MSPSIADLFATPDQGGSTAPFDPANLNAALDQVMAGRATALPNADGVTPGNQPPAGPTATASPSDGSVGPEVEPSGGTHPLAGVAVLPPGEPAPPTLGVVPPADPLAALDAERRNELALIARSLDDPERALQIRQAYLGVAQAPPAAAAPAPVAEPEPQLPEHVTPQSFEAELWRQNQAVRQELAQLRQAQAQTVEQQGVAAANRAAARFTARYPQLAQREIEAIATVAGRRGLPAAMIQTNGGDVERGIYDSLDFVLRSTDTLLSRVLGGGVAPAVGGTPAQVPTAGAVVPAQVYPPQPTPVQAQRRALTALSTGASPVGVAPQAPQIQTDYASGGRMQETSRAGLVNQVAAALAADGGGI